MSRAIAAEAARLPRGSLAEAAARLSAGYREGAPVRLDEAGRAAYLAMRLPATYAAVNAALRETLPALDRNRIRTCLDVGAGPGTASFAVREVLGDCAFTQIERDAGWAAIGARLATAMGMKAARVVGDIGGRIAQSADLVVASYVLNEMTEPALDAAVRGIWAAATSVLVIVEPGTPHGFTAVRRARELCLAAGGVAVAPCTHSQTCPMSARDWCHRPVRVERGELHRLLKHATLGFEDEKFSYVAIARAAAQDEAAGRIVRKPIRAGGHVHLDLCTHAGLKRETIGKADDRYRAARKADWGDLWPPMPASAGDGA